MQEVHGLQRDRLNDDGTFVQILRRRWDPEAMCLRVDVLSGFYTKMIGNSTLISLPCVTKICLAKRSGCCRNGNILRVTSCFDLLHKL